MGPRWYCTADEEIEPPPSMAACLGLAAVIGTRSVTLTFHHTLLKPVIQSKANLLFCFPIIVKWRALNEEEEIMKLTSQLRAILYGTMIRYSLGLGNVC